MFETRIKSARNSVPITPLPSTIVREIKRNAGLRGYSPKQANALSDQKKRQAHKHLKMILPIRHQIKVWLIRKASAIY